MREILFKAKRIDNGEWVEGLLWKKKYNSDTNFISCFPDKDDNEKIYVVDPNTICQYTGLTDKNGNKIWENDVCQYIEADECGIKIEPFVVRYGRKVELFRIDIGFFVDWIKTDYYRCDLGFWAENRNIEVIGNIFDNPELLKGAQP